jgi:hypothetical protein
MTLDEMMTTLKGCCEPLPNGKMRFTKAGKIRLKEIMAEHGISVEIDESDEIREVIVTRHDPRADH